MRWRGFEEAINNITNMFVLQTFKSESFCKYVLYMGHQWTWFKDMDIWLLDQIKTDTH